MAWITINITKCKWNGIEMNEDFWEEDKSNLSLCVDRYLIAHHPYPHLLSQIVLTPLVVVWWSFFSFCDRSPRVDSSPSAYKFSGRKSSIAPDWAHRPGGIASIVQSPNITPLTHGPRIRPLRFGTFVLAQGQGIWCRQQTELISASKWQLVTEPQA